MADIISTLFGITPQQAKDQRLERDLSLGGLFAAATMNPYASPSVQNAYLKQQQAQFALGSMGARGLGSLFGLQDPEVKKAADIESILSQTQEELGPEGLSDPETLNTTLAKKLSEAGYGREASMLMMQAAPQIQQTKLAKAKAAQEQLVFNQEQTLRQELANLPPDADDEAYLNIVKRYAPAKDVMNVLERKETARQAREAKLEETRERLAQQQQMLEMRLQDQALAREERRALQLQLAQMQIDGRRQMAEMTAAMKMADNPLRLSTGQKEIDKAFGKEYADYVALGGKSVIDKNLDSINETINIITKGQPIKYDKDGNPILPKDLNEVTGKIVSAKEKTLGDFGLTTDELRARDLAAGVVQGNLREVLGGQFAMREGEQLLARAYNIASSPEDNLKRLLDLKKQIEAAAAAKQASVEYFDKYGTLSGFKGLESGDQKQNILPKGSRVDDPLGIRN